MKETRTFLFSERMKGISGVAQAFELYGLFIRVFLAGIRSDCTPEFIRLQLR